MTDKTDKKKSPAGRLGGAENNRDERYLHPHSIKSHHEYQYIWENTHLADTAQARAAYWIAKAIEAESLARLEELGETLGGENGA